MTTRRFDEVFETYLSSTDRTRRVCLVLMSAVRDIAVSEISLDGGIAMKHLAEQALIDSTAILNEGGNEKCQSTAA
ncbi:MAG: hypothetical protein KIS76_03970 [Pyrinomonadaceae bacterium]|nr:hypothetical protein [Pyrinomonadaceae bacterium]